MEIYYTINAHVYVYIYVCMYIYLRSSSTQHVQRTVAARDFATQWGFVIQSYTNAFWVKWKKHPLWLEALATSKKHICLKLLEWSFKKWQNLRMHFFENTKSMGHGWHSAISRSVSPWFRHLTALYDGPRSSVLPECFTALWMLFSELSKRFLWKPAQTIWEKKS